MKFSIRLINLLRKIIMLTFNYEISREQIEMLKVYIQKYIELHDKYYSSSYPKLHYLVHIPNDIEKYFKFIYMKSNYLRFGPSIFYSCLKFERCHQLIKEFSKNSNYLNISKTITEKYLLRLELENCGQFEYKEHPVSKRSLVIKRKSNKITSIEINGCLLKNLKQTVVMTRNKRCYFVVDMVIENENQYIIGKEYQNIQFSNQLMGYQFEKISKNPTKIPFDTIWMNVGHVYNFMESRCIYFNKIPYFYFLYVKKN